MCRPAVFQAEIPHDRGQKRLLTTAWCVAENIMLAVINEGLGYSLRIPLNKEHNIVLEKLGVPAGWMTPCFIGIGYPKEDERILEQYDTKPDKHIHMGAW